MRGSDVAPLQDGREHLQLSHLNVSRFFDFDASSDTNDVIGAEDLASLRTAAYDVISEAGSKRTDRLHVTLDWSRLSGVIYFMVALDVLLLLYRLSNLCADVTCLLWGRRERQVLRASSSPRYTSSLKYRSLSDSATDAPAEADQTLLTDVTLQSHDVSRSSAQQNGGVRSLEGSSSTGRISDLISHRLLALTSQAARSLLPVKLLIAAVLLVMSYFLVTWQTLATCALAFVAQVRASTQASHAARVANINAMLRLQTTSASDVIASIYAAAMEPVVREVQGVVVFLGSSE